MVDVIGIDHGDAVLVASCISKDSSLLTTSDKRCLQAVESNDALAAVRSAIAGRVRCLEQVIKQTIASKGLDFVWERVLPGRDCDTVLQIVFSDARERTEESVLQALDSYIRDLRDSTGDLLIV